MIGNIIEKEERKINRKWSKKWNGCANELRFFIYTQDHSSQIEWISERKKEAHVIFT